MDVRASRVAVAAAVVATVATLGLSGWWIASPRPTLEGVAVGIDKGRFRAAEIQLRDYLAAFPGDETATLLLAQVLVRRPEPASEEALGLVGQLQPADSHRAALARTIEGDAHFWSGAYQRAEAAWLAALKQEPSIPEVGWKLLNIYAIQGRDEDSRKLALRLFAVEPDERDRVQLLIQLIRRDAHPNELGTIIQALEPVVRVDPSDVWSSVALGSALVGTGRAEEGISLLRRFGSSSIDDASARLAYLEGLISLGDVEELVIAMDKVDGPLAASSRFEAIRGWLANQRGESDAAARQYHRALDARVDAVTSADVSLAYRFRQALRIGGRVEELRELDPRLEPLARLPEVLRDFFDRLSERPDLGLKSHPEEFEALAATLRQVGRVAEADAWLLLARRGGKGAT